MQREENPEAGRLKGLHLQDLQRRLQRQAKWVLGKVQLHSFFTGSFQPSIFLWAFQSCSCAVRMLNDGLGYCVSREGQSASEAAGSSWSELARAMCHLCKSPEVDASWWG